MIVFSVTCLIVTVSQFALIYGWRWSCLSKFPGISNFLSCTNTKHQQMKQIDTFSKRFSLTAIVSYLLLCLSYTIYPLICYWALFVVEKNSSKLYNTGKNIDIFVSRPLWAFCKFPIYILFLRKLNYTFGNTRYAISFKYFVLLVSLMLIEFIIVVFANISNVVYVATSIKQYERMLIYCLFFDIILDSSIAIIFITLYVVKLKQMSQQDILQNIQMSGSGIGSIHLHSASGQDTGITKEEEYEFDNNLLATSKQQQILYFMTKYTILCIGAMMFEIVSGLLASLRTYLNINNHIDSSCAEFDNCFVLLWMFEEFFFTLDCLINLMCFYLNFNVQHDNYMYLCGICHGYFENAFKNDIKKNAIEQL